MKRQIFMFFMVGVLVPIILITLAVSFVHLDLSLLNPVNWKEGARVSLVLWVGTVLMITLAIVAKAYE